MKIFYTLFFMFILSSCASAPSQLYRPANYNGSPWNISGEMNHFTNRITIKINNNVVIDGTLSFLSGDGEFFGYYESKQVTASCMTSMGSFSEKTNCFVFVDGEKAATLTFTQ